MVRFLADFLADEIDNGGERFHVACDEADPLVGARVEVVGLGHLDARPHASLDFSNCFAAFSDYSACTKLVQKLLRNVRIV